MKLFFRNMATPGAGIDRNAAPKKGFARLWEIFTLEFKSIFLLSLVFTLFSLPVVTIPAAICAMTRIIVYMIDDRPRFLWHDFVKAFKENFKSATLLGGGVLLAMALFAFGILFYREGFSANIYLIIPAILLAVGFIALNQMSFYMYPMLARTNLSRRAIFKNSFFLLFVKGNGIKNLAMIAFEAALLLLSLAFAPYSFFIYPLLGFSVLSLCATFAAWPSIVKYVIRDEKEQSDKDDEQPAAPEQ